ncbi:MAG: biopolymer transporter ExbD [Bacteroidetes bacterium]|nr:biopolymer transporter ExbD [Bacteroidota bacterium]MBS1541825.1 biopolymer transporter ExbD [Bacteroidota bacterium]
MSKVKMHRSSPSIDMTPMVDLAFLLVTFFMLTATARPDEPVEVSAPSSVSEMPIPERDLIIITISKDNRVFFNVDGQPTRERLLAEMGSLYNISFTPEQKDVFKVLTTFGMPIQTLGQFLDLSREERKEVKQPGIPVDSLNNQLKDWVLQTRLANPRVRIAIKGDGDAGYPVLKKVINTLVDRKVNRFNLITGTEEMPAEMKAAQATAKKPS